MIESAIYALLSLMGVFTLGAFFWLFYGEGERSMIDLGLTLIGSLLACVLGIYLFGSLFPGVVAANVVIWIRIYID